MTKAKKWTDLAHMYNKPDGQISQPYKMATQQIWPPKCMCNKLWSTSGSTHLFKYFLVIAGILV